MSPNTNSSSALINQTQSHLFIFLGIASGRFAPKNKKDFRESIQKSSGIQELSGWDSPAGENTPKKDPKKGVFLTPQKGGVGPPSGGYPPKPVRGGPRRLGIGTFFGTPPARGVGDPKKGVGPPPKRVKKWVIFERFLDPFSGNRRVYLFK